MIPYKKVVYLYPPRPALFHPSDVEKLDNGEYWAQLKLDDTRNLIVIEPGRTKRDGQKIHMFNRHNQPHSAYKVIHPEILYGLSHLNLDKKKFYVFDSLLLHSKNKLVKDTVVLIDMLVSKSRYLYMTTYKERYEEMKKVCWNADKPEERSGLRLGTLVFSNVWLINNIETGFALEWKRWEKTFNNGQRIVEGLVFKRKEGQLGYHYSEDKSSWQGKIRFPKKGYEF